MEVNTAAYNMVQQQVRTWDVLNPAVLHSMLTVPREPFVLPEFKNLANSDAFIPIGYNQVSLKPNIVGRILQAIQLRKKDRVLEVGTGTGYITALIAQFAENIFSIEIIPELSKQANDLLKKLSIYNVNLEIGNAAMGFAMHAPYDVIIMTGALPYLPKDLCEQLSFNGRLFVVIGTSPSMSALLITRHGKYRFSKKVLFETDIPLLINGPELNKFIF